MPATKKNLRMKKLTDEQLENRYYKRVLGPGTILILREKHAHRHFRADTLEKFCAAALFVLRERWGPDGYWGKASKMAKEYEGYIEALEKPEVEVEQFKTMLPRGLHNSGIIRELEARWKKYHHQTAEYMLEVTMYRRIAEAVKKRDGFEAAQIILDRGDHEYEGYEFERLEDPLNEPEDE